MSVKARNSLRSNVSSFGCMKRNRTIPPVGQRVSESLDRRAECLNVRPRASQSRPRAVPNDHPRRTARKISAGFARTARLEPPRLTPARASPRLAPHLPAGHNKKQLLPSAVTYEEEERKKKSGRRREEAEERKEKQIADTPVGWGQRLYAVLYAFNNNQCFAQTMRRIQRDPPLQLSSFVFFPKIFFRKNQLDKGWPTY